VPQIYKVTAGEIYGSPERKSQKAISKQNSLKTNIGNTKSHKEISKGHDVDNRPYIIDSSGIRKSSGSRQANGEARRIVTGTTSLLTGRD
jgi:hypothetical protein